MSNTSNYQTVQIAEMDSFNYKLKRIQREENFKQANKEKFELLTKREVEILYLLANDLNNPQIAEALYISRYTVEQHRKNINRKLCVHSYVQLFQYALAFNLV